MTVLVNPFRFGSKSLLSIIGRQGADAGLVCCLDAGDINSYASGQTWTDVSTNGNHFFRGTTSGSEASDPTFNGTPGDLADTCYWTTDGGDSFTEASNLSFADTWGADGTKFSLLAVFYPTSNPASAAPLFTNGATNNTRLEVLSTGPLRINMPSDTAVATVASVSANAWNFGAVSMDENGGAAGSLIRLQTTDKTFNGSRSSPDAISGAYTIFSGFRSGDRLSMFAAWAGVALSSAVIGNIYSEIKALRHTTLP